MATLHLSGGALALVGIDALPDPFLLQVPPELKASRAKRDGAHYHITLASKAELRSLPAAVGSPETLLQQLQAAFGSLDPVVQQPIALALASPEPGSAAEAEVYFVALAWPFGAAVRRALGLPRKNFHITVGFRAADCHDEQKRRLEMIELRAVSPTQRLVASLTTYLRLRRQQPTVTKSEGQLAVPVAEGLSDAAEDIAALLSRLTVWPQLASQSQALVLCERSRVLGKQGRLSEALDAALSAWQQATGSPAPTAPRPAPSSAAAGSKAATERWHVTTRILPSGVCEALGADSAVKAKPSKETDPEPDLPLMACERAVAALMADLAQRRVPMFAATASTGTADEEAAAADDGQDDAETAAVDPQWSQLIALLDSGLALDGGMASGVLRHAVRFVTDHQLKAQRGNTRYRVQCGALSLPRNFSWVVPQKLAGMSKPLRPAHLHMLALLGVTDVFTIMEEPCIPTSWVTMPGVQGFPIRVHHVPVDNYCPPTEAQAEAFLDVCTQAKGAVVIHCGGGKGRAGSFLTIAMLHALALSGEIFTRSVQSLIAELRHMRPGSIETVPQEQFLVTFADRLRRRAAAGELGPTDDSVQAELKSPFAQSPTSPSTASSPAPPTATSAARLASLPHAILLTGLPGSGKSTLAQVIKELTEQSLGSPDAVEWLNQDTIGSRSEIEGLWTAAVRRLRANKPDGVRLVILDRCTPTQAERDEWADGVANAVVVYLSTPPSECVTRVATRAGHPTIRVGTDMEANRARATRIIGEFETKFEAPGEAGKGKRSAKGPPTYSVSSVQEGVALVHKFLPLLDEGIIAATYQRYIAESAAASRQLLGFSALGDAAAPESEHNGAPAFKFPRTPHLLALGDNIARDDLVLTPPDAAVFCSGNAASVVAAGRSHSNAAPRGGHQAASATGPLVVTVEEKVDGANLGISIDPATYEFRFQNRSHFVNHATAAQFEGLEEWLATHSAELFRLLDPSQGRLILFGEWLLAKHSVAYTRLPNYFLVFDIFDMVAQRFLSVAERDRRLQEAEVTLPTVPRLAQRVFASMDQITSLLTRRSSFNPDVQIEGVYCRIDDPADPRFLLRRAKIVNADFVQAIDVHWSRKTMVKNKLVY